MHTLSAICPLFILFIMQNNTVADPGFLKGGFSFSLTKAPAQFEFKTKKKKKRVINLHTPLSPVFYIYCWIISTVIGAFQSDCSIRESRSDCSIRVYEFQKGVSVETLKPPWISHCNKDNLRGAVLLILYIRPVCCSLMLIIYCT